ncbi:MAG: hypothetical protein GX442_16240 [Candidatus Riflebacteria bacterium]|nr:hypothetical protein [Candidatus Riflebacteria bacterium]
MKHLWRTMALAVLLAVVAVLGTGPNGHGQTLEDMLDNQGDETRVIALPGAASQTVAARWEELWKALTPREQEFIRRGLLPKTYAILKDLKARGGPTGAQQAKDRARRGKPGQPSFADSYGDPDVMLAWAENNQGNARLCGFVKSIKKGDIILAGPGATERRDKDTICFLTRGPYHHSLLCVSEGPPPEFIDAVGKGVVRTQWTYFWGGANYRIVRPTASLPPDQAKKAVEAAVGYAIGQLGKPYDLAFTDADGDRSFYCSELALKAYRDGAGLTNLLPAKSPERDQLVVSLWAVIDGLGPTDRHAMMDGLLHTVKRVSESKPPDWGTLDAYVIDEVLPKCSAAAGLLATPANRRAAKEVVKAIREGRAFTRFQAADAEYQKAEAAGRFTDHWYTFGTGKARQAGAQAKRLWALGQDLWAVKRSTGLSLPSAFGLVCRVFLPFYRNLGTFAGAANQAGSQGLIALPAGVRTALAATEALATVREKTAWIPLLGSVTQLLPGKAPPRVQGDFTSPTDLSQLSEWHQDYEP